MLHALMTIRMRLIDTNLVITAGVLAGKEINNTPTAFSLMTLLGFGSQESSGKEPKATLNVLGSDQASAVLLIGLEAAPY